jgi:magnesium-transporting ATPase (P-type)
MPEYIDVSWMQVGLVSRDALDASNLLLRGCTLRKTEWVIGVVVFTRKQPSATGFHQPAAAHAVRSTTSNIVVVADCSCTGTQSHGLAYALSS